MPGDTRSQQNGIALPATEIDALKDLEGLLLANGSLSEGETIPVVSKDDSDIRESTTGYCAENNTIVALSLRYCALTDLPAYIGKLPKLEKLDVRWNKLSYFPEWLQRLEQRGCTVFK